MKQKVVIIGHSYSSHLGIIRSVAQMGCEITVIVMTGSKRDGRSIIDKKPIDCYSKYVSRILYCNRKDQDALIALLTEKCQDLHQKVVLIPDGDDVVSTIDNNKDVLKEHFLYPHVAKEPSSLEYWMDKANQKRLAKGIGLNVADATMIEIEDGLYSLPADIEYPCFPKPLATMNGGKGGMRRCNDNKELASALDDFIIHWNQTGKILVEDYKEITNEYALLGFSNGKDVMIPGIMQLLVISQQYQGIALQGRVTSISGFEDVVEKFKQLVKQIGFVGLFDIDFYESGGKLYSVS
jgi:predicted ATP-grasp superfamily ATP-dependent carboligase